MKTKKNSPENLTGEAPTRSKHRTRKHYLEAIREEEAKDELRKYIDIQDGIRRIDI